MEDRQKHGKVVFDPRKHEEVKPPHKEVKESHKAQDIQLIDE